MTNMKKQSWLLLTVALSVLLGASACQTDAYCFVCEKPSSTGGAGGGTGSGGTPIFNQDSGSGGGGGVDSGADSGRQCSNTLTDPQNCGTCGHRCSIPGAYSTCVAGQCTFAGCAPGLVDLNKNTALDGCECTLTNTTTSADGGVTATEICDGVDNDCNGIIDDGFDLTTDVNNCGACNNKCPALPNSTATCVPVSLPAPGQPVGQCDYACSTGYSSLTGIRSEVGCPYKCPVFPATTETCNGVDDDCDGSIDNGDPGAGVACSTNCPENPPGSGNHQCLGICTTGVTACTGTTAGLVCVGGGGAIPELCDGLDNNCNGTTDEGFNLQTDPLNCGKCNQQCQAGDLCVGGVCQFTCPVGYKDIDKIPTNGCEYACPVMPTTAEACNGLDDDCNGLIDDGIALGGSCSTDCPAPAPCVTAGSCTPYAIAPNSGACYGVCSSGGALACVAGKSVCQYSNQTATETCNGLDDNCDGRVDEGFNKQQDPLNCGSCGKVCTAPNAATITCSAGACTTIVTCSPGYADLKNGISDGCEYKCPVYPPQGESCNGVDDDCNGLVDDNLTGFGQACAAQCAGFPLDPCIAAGTCTASLSTAVNGCYGVCATDGKTACLSQPAIPLGATICTHPFRGTEVCDGLDNNCNGTIDENVNKQTDPNNCGACGNVCTGQVPNSTGVQCVTGQCRATGCQPGYLFQSGSCSYKCPVFPTTAEVCNGIDDDCNGVIDNAPTDLGSCSTNCPGGVCKGICTPGTLACLSGQKVCQGGTGPQLEVCNNLDDDCDGTVDNGFNKQTDPLNCGSCGNKCALANTDVNGCVAGACTVVSCSPGFGNADNNPLNGCEYTCPVYPTQVETCNGKDDNCNGLVDGADSSMATPANFCKTLGACAGSSPQCTGATGWRCNYSTSVDVAPSGDVLTLEARCDGLDNNCNGQVDETFSQLGQKCSVGTGICAGTSTYVCSTDKLGVSCPATATPGAAKDELCNGLDDNCDGLIDERTPVSGTFAGWIDPMVHVGSVWVYAYEAARPDSTASSAGSTTTRACSDSGRLPWTSVNESDAAAACSAIKNSAGQPMRLCTATEWQAACEAGGTGTLWSYATTPGTYSSGTCNDNNVVSGAPPTSAVWATGNGASCYANWGGAGKVFDMSGNVAEWTSTTATVNSATYNRVRGGSYSTFPSGTTCEFNFVLEQPTYQNFDLGFRCCSDAAP